MEEDGRGAGRRWKKGRWRLDIRRTSLPSVRLFWLCESLPALAYPVSLSFYGSFILFISSRFPLPSHSKDFMIHRSSQFHESRWLGKHGWWFIRSKSSRMWTSSCLISNELGRLHSHSLLFFILHIIIPQVEAVIATHILSSSLHLIGLVLVKTWENGWQIHALDWLSQFVPDFLNFFKYFWAGLHHSCSEFQKAGNTQKSQSGERGLIKQQKISSETWEKKKKIHGHGQWRSWPKRRWTSLHERTKEKDREKKRKTKLELSGTTPEGQEICSPNQLPDRHHRNSGRGNPKRSPPGWMGTVLAHEALEKRRKKRVLLCNSQQVIHFALYILPEDPTDFFLSFFPEGIMAAIVTAFGAVWHGTMRKNGAKWDLGKDDLVLLAAEKHGHEMTRQREIEKDLDSDSGRWDNMLGLCRVLFCRGLCVGGPKSRSWKTESVHHFFSFCLFVYERLIADISHPTIILWYILGICIQHKVPHCLPCLFDEANEGNHWIYHHWK